jgi:methylenetetrahydrofolate dehydrogenase (NADP+)/methenyltetrahydrofolate cyclohydrolase
MSALLLDGRNCSRDLAPGLRRRIAALSQPPGLAVVLVGADPASQVYVGKKHERAERLGFFQRHHELPASTSQSELEALIADLNADKRVHGILVQLPLPGHLDSGRVLACIDPAKDVDGFQALNTGLLSQGHPRLVPCTPLGVMRLLSWAGVELAGKEAVVVGRSNIVGRPMAMLLEQANATVTLCHSRTRDLEAHIRRAEILVAAIGRPHAIPAAWVRPGAIVVDVGINRLPDGNICGDIELTPLLSTAAALTPVPGGVGPMTISMLMENTVRAAELALQA